jgi:precorrin-2 dehydrogenase / sirohydrochlorin ferrochelatase
MDVFPAYFPLKGRRVVIAGEGEGAEAKARLFADAPAEIVRLNGEAALKAASYKGATLAFIAHADPAFLAQAAAAARKACVPVNVVDRPGLCDFNTPAVIDRGEVVAAVGTGGSAPLLASLLRADIEARVPEGAGWVAALLRKMQIEVRAAFPDLPARRAFLRRVIDGDEQVVVLVRRDARRLMGREATLDGMAELAQQGLQIVRLVVGPPPAGLELVR